MKDSSPNPYHKARKETIFYAAIAWLICLIPWLTDFNSITRWNIWISIMCTVLIFYALLPGMDRRKLNWILFSFFIIWLMTVLHHFVWSQIIALCLLFDRFLFYNFHIDITTYISDRLERWYNKITN